PGNQEKPTEATEIASNEFAMRPDRAAQSFVVKSERNLHRTENDDDSTHHNSLDREIIKHIGNVHEISQQQRESNDQRAHQHDDAGPFQNIAEPAHAEAKQFAHFNT